MKPETTEKESVKEPSLNIPGKLPFEDYDSAVNLADLLKILVNKGVLSVEDYELLVMRGYMFPLLNDMTQDNWMEIKAQLLEFMGSGQEEPFDETGQRFYTCLQQV